MSIYRNSIVIITLVAGIAVAIAYGIYQYKMPVAEKTVDIMLYNLRSGREVLLNDILSVKPTVIYYTSNNCPVCKRQRQVFDSIPNREKSGAQWLDVLATPENITEWMQENGNKHDIVTLDYKREFGRSMRLYSTPVVMLVDKTGKIVEYHRGFIDERSWKEQFYPKLLSMKFYY